MSKPKKKNSNKDNKEPNSPPTIGSEENSSESVNGLGLQSIQKKNPLAQKTLQDRKLLALKRIKVKPEQIEVAPPISDILKKSKGGLRGLIKAMRFATEDSEIRCFLEKYDSIPPGDRQYLPWEAIAISAGVNLKYLLGAVQIAGGQYFGNISRMIAISHHPSITSARVKYAKDPSGERDRQSLDIMVGALPSAKGPTFIGKAVFGPSSKESDDDDEDTPKSFGDNDDFDQVFPLPVDMQEKLKTVRQNQLEAPKS